MSAVGFSTSHECVREHCVLCQPSLSNFLLALCNECTWLIWNSARWDSEAFHRTHDVSACANKLTHSCHVLSTTELLTLKSHHFNATWCALSTLVSPRRYPCSRGSLLSWMRPQCPRTWRMLWFVPSLLQARSRDVRRGLFLSQKMHRSVTAKHLLPDMFLRCDTKKHWKLRNLTDIVFVRQDARKGPRSTMALYRRCFFQVTAELQRMPIDTSASI